MLRKKEVLRLFESDPFIITRSNIEVLTSIVAFDVLDVFDDEDRRRTGGDGTSTADRRFPFTFTWLTSLSPVVDMCRHIIRVGWVRWIERAGDQMYMVGFDVCVLGERMGWTARWMHAMRWVALCTARYFIC